MLGLEGPSIAAPLFCSVMMIMMMIRVMIRGEEFGI
jgi:hypothetical protein